MGTRAQRRHVRQIDQRTDDTYWLVATHGGERLKAAPLPAPVLSCALDRHPGEYLYPAD